MKRLLSFITAFALLFSVSAAAESSPITQMEIRFTDANDIIHQYVTSDAKKVKLLNENRLYCYDISSGETNEEYVFPQSEYKSDYSGGYIGSQSRPRAYLDERQGLIYFGYNAYTNVYSDDEIIYIVVYDLEKGAVIKTVSASGHILKSVGADPNGNIFISTDDYYRSDGEEGDRLIVLDGNGNLLCSSAVEYPYNSFCGFASDGTFYYIDEYTAYSAYGYANLMGRLRKASFNGSTVLFDESYLFYAKNIYFYDRYDCVNIADDKYIVTAMGQVIPLDSVTDKSYSVALYAANELEMGSDHDFIYSAGVNMLIDGDDVYALSDNNTIIKYSLSSGEKLEYCDTEHFIFNMKKCGDSIIALETDGTDYYYEQIAFSQFSEITVSEYNMNEFSAYNNRSKEDIVKRYSEAVPEDYSAPLYETEGSGTAPYSESKLTADTQDTALRLSNYYRWLAGLTEFESADEETWTNAAKGAVLLNASDFSHSPAQPDDMDDSFYAAAESGTSSSNIAMNYAANQNKLIYSIRQFLNDLGDNVPGHRNNFLTRNATKIAYGAFSQFVCQTVEYSGNPNPQGTAEIDNNEAAYAWPPAGYFPAEELSRDAYWTVNLNTDRLSLSNLALTVTITDLDTGEEYTRTSSGDGLYSSSYWGKFICFAPPETSDGGYAGKRYKVVLSNLADSAGFPAELSYTVDFFSYEGRFKINGKEYNCDQKGKLTEIQSIESMEVSVSYAETPYSGIAKKPSVTINGLKNGVDYTVAYADNINAGVAKIIIKGIGNYAGTIEKQFTILPLDIGEKSVQLSQTAFLYDGKQHTPGVTVSELKEGVDFEVEYPEDVITAGTKTVTIKGIGNYSGIITETYIISDDTPIKGDVNLDGDISLMDVRIMINAIANNVQFDESMMYIADVTEDGVLSLFDVRLLIAMIANG